MRSTTLAFAAALLSALVAAPAGASDNSKSKIDKDTLLANGPTQQDQVAQDQWNHTYNQLNAAVLEATQMVSLAQSELDYAQSTLQMLQQFLFHGSSFDGTPGWGWAAVQLAQQYTVIMMPQGGPSVPNLDAGVYSTQLLEMQGLQSYAQYMSSRIPSNNLLTQIQIGVNLTQDYVQNVLNRIQLTYSNAYGGQYAPVGPTDNPETNQLNYYLSNPNPKTIVVDYNLADQALAYWTQIVQVDQVVLQRAQAALAQANQQLSDFSNTSPSPNGAPAPNAPGQTSDADDPNSATANIAGVNAANASVDAGGAADGGDAGGD